MSKIIRKTATIFGSSALANQIAQFGSLAASAPAYSTDPNVIQGLGNWASGWFAGVEGASSPAIEDLNAFCYVDSYQLAYLLQEGVAEWDPSTTYYIGSVVNDGTGNLFASKINSNLNNGTSVQADWLFLAGKRTLGSANGNVVISASSGTVGQVFSSSSPAVITNLSVNLTVTGKPVMVILSPDNAGLSPSGILSGSLTTSAGVASGSVQLFRGATGLGTKGITFPNGFTTPGTGAFSTPGNFDMVYIDTPAAGNYTWTAQAAYVQNTHVSGGQLAVYNLVLTVFEIA